MELFTAASVAAAITVCLVHLVWKGYKAVLVTVENITQVIK
jgi:hypothetical protein